KSRFSFLFCLVISSAVVNGQVCDRVSLGAGFAQQQFYSLEAGLVHTLSVDDWDLRFNYFDYSIDINEAKGVRAWVQTTNDNANTFVGTSNAQYNPNLLDTSGLQTGSNDWVELHNNVALKTLGGAFNSIIQNPPKGGVQEYGHSFYAPSGAYAQMHGIHGYRNFVVRLTNGQFIQVFPEISHSSTQQVIGLANLDGINNRNLVFDKNNYEDQEWAYFNHTNDSLFSPSFAPNLDAFDLVLTRYFNEQLNRYEVGVLANKGVGLAQEDGV
ncbi:unnamed protein product, partial [Chrysoparadoxa australica]